MTRKELWHVKIGTKIERTSWNGSKDVGVVIKREIHEEICGFLIGKHKTTGKIIEKDFTTGKKYLTVTIAFGNDIRYIDTTAEQYRLDAYTILG